MDLNIEEPAEVSDQEDDGSRVARLDLVGTTLSNLSCVH